MLAVAFSLLFGCVAAKNYYLGDDISITLKVLDFKVITPVNVTAVYILFPGLSSGNKIHFELPTPIHVRDRSPVHTTLSINFGTEQKPLVLPAIADGLAEIHAVGILHKAASTPKDIILENVTISRHVQYFRRGVVGAFSALPKSFQLYTFFPTAHKISMADWVVELVYIKSPADTHFTVYDTLTVTKVAKSSTWYTVDGTWKKTSPTPMTYMLLVGVKNGTKPFNSYAINANKESVRYSFTIIDPKNFSVTVPASIPEYKPMSIKFNDGGVGGKHYWWVIAEEKTSMLQYALSCMSQKASAFGEFEWYTRTVGFTTYPQLPVGDYSLWVNLVDSAMSDVATSANEYPMMKTSASMKVTPHEQMWKYPVTFSKNNMPKLGKDLKKNSNISVTLHSSFSKVWVQWFRKMKNASYENSSLGNRTRGWTPDGAKKMYNMMPGTNITIYVVVPDSGLNLTLSTEVRLYGWTEDCYGDHFGQNFVSGNITTGGGSPGTTSGSNKLGPGAIVGIVCAVVFVCGVAAWWLCMRKSSNPDRYQKLEHN